MPVARATAVKAAGRGGTARVPVSGVVTSRYLAFGEFSTAPLVKVYELADTFPWQLAPDPIATLPNAAVFGAGFSSQHFAYGQGSGSAPLKAFSLSGGMPWGEVPITGYGGGVVADLTFSASRLYVASGSGQRLYAFETSDFVALPAADIPPGGSGNTIAVNQEDTLVAMGHNSGDYLSFYDVSVTPFVKRSVTGGLPSTPARNGSFNSALGIFAVAASNSPYVFLYDTATLQRLSDLPLALGISGRLAKFNHAGTLLMVGTQGGGLRVFATNSDPDPANWTLQAPPDVPPAGTGPADLNWSIDDRYIALSTGEVYDTTSIPFTLIVNALSTPVVQGTQAVFST